MSLSYGKQDCNVLKIGLEGPGLGDYSHFLLFGGQWSRSLMPLQIGRPAAPSQSPGADPRAFTMGWGEKSSFNCSDGGQPYIPTKWWPIQPDWGPLRLLSGVVYVWILYHVSSQQMLRNTDIMWRNPSWDMRSLWDPEGQHTTLPRPWWEFH